MKFACTYVFCRLRDSVYIQTSPNSNKYFPRKHYKKENHWRVQKDSKSFLHFNGDVQVNDSLGNVKEVI